MNNKTTIIAILRKEKPRLFAQYPIVGIALFGSYARDEQSPASDIDLLIDVNGKMGFKFIDLCDEFEKILKHKVDVVSKRALKPLALEFISKDMIYV
jgi:uncharacterized protein